MDHVSPTRRSWLMSRVKSKNTAPEMRVRKVAHALGYRFRLHQRHLPGSPDLVFARLRSVVFVHGCFWHRHPRCGKSSTPTTRKKFWNEKFARNVARDASVRQELRRGGWRVCVIWECETKKSPRLVEKLRRFLGSGEAASLKGTISRRMLRRKVQ
jgi:DNA mismatch endonuclease (patch repair protein)